MFKSATDISESKEFRRLDDGRYQFRDQPWSRTVILDADTAVRVFQAREKLIRQSFWLVAVCGGLGSILWPLYKLGFGFSIPLVLIFVLLPIGIYSHFAKERAYYRIVRNAPTASDKLPFQWKLQWAQAAQRLPTGMVNFAKVFSPVFTAFMALGVWAALSGRETNWPMFILCASLSLLGAGLSAFYWKVWLIQNDNRASRGTAGR